MSIQCWEINISWNMPQWDQLWRLLFQRSPDIRRSVHLNKKLRYFETKLPPISPYLYNPKYRSIFASFRLNSFTYHLKFDRTRAMSGICVCGEDLNSYHILESCSRLSYSCALLKKSCNVSSSSKIASLFNHRENYESLYFFLSKSWFMLCASSF